MDLTIQWNWGSSGPQDSMDLTVQWISRSSGPHDPMDLTTQWTSRSNGPPDPIIVTLHVSDLLFLSDFFGAALKAKRKLWGIGDRFRTLTVFATKNCIFLRKSSDSHRERKRALRGSKRSRETSLQFLQVFQKRLKQGYYAVNLFFRPKTLTGVGQNDLGLPAPLPA